MVKTVRNLTVLGAGLAVSAVVGWLLLRESRRGKLAERVFVRSRLREATSEPVTEIILPLDKIELQPEPALRPAADDFTRIKDVGPRFAQAMREAGITSFGQLAALTPDALSDRLAPFVAVRAQRIHSNDWIGQARHLAASAE
jgi:predicted flap endonuclease-1-like 5' DNA nuclease